MPNRIIKETIWTSPNLNELSVWAERHFYRILLLPDDFGCCELTSVVVKGRCYPRQQRITIKQIEQWQDELEGQGLIVRWNHGGRQYGIFPTFGRHQRIRSVHLRKTPKPPDDIIVKVEAILTNDDSCRQMTTSDGLNPNPNPNPNPKKRYAERISLTETEYQKLIERFGEKDTLDRIEALSLYKRSKNKRYASDYATILNWARRDTEKEKKQDDGIRTHKGQPTEADRRAAVESWKE